MPAARLAMGNFLSPGADMAWTWPYDGPMTLAVLYRWRLHPGQEATFAAAWAELTEVIAGRFGTGGSRLHQADDGSWVAYAVWPSRQAWDQADVGEHPAMPAMQACVAERFPPMPLTITHDLLR